MGNPTENTGTIIWTDLTVENTEEVRDFYSEVVGWKALPVPMGGYDDFNMTTPVGGNSTAGICHARGINVGLPHQWLIYIVVDDVHASSSRCKELGGEVVVEPREMGTQGRYCVIRDPAGAVAALITPAK